ncbi:zeta toxin family protein [Patescibacteria group bacterium]
MKQFLVIIRGAPASGKTTIAKKFVNYDKKIVWLKVDNFKPFFGEKALLKHQNDVDQCALSTLKYLLDTGFSVVMEKIFYDPSVIPLAVDEAKEREIKVAVFQIKCSLKTLQKRDRARPGIKEGCRKPMGDKAIERIHRQLEETFYPKAIELDTEKLAVNQCILMIKKQLNI